MTRAVGDGPGEGAAAAGDELVAFFERGARAYDRQLVLERRALRAAADLAGPLAGRRVMDLACGTGALAAEMVRRGGLPAELVAVDAAPAMLRRAGARLAPLGPRARTLLADVRAVPLGDGWADVVGTGYLLHLLDPPALAAALDEARRLLAPGGLLVAVVHGSPHGMAGSAYRAGWRLLSRVLPRAIVGGGPMVDLAPDLRATGLAVDASRRIPGAYWSQVVRARAQR